MQIALTPTREKYPLSERKIFKKTLNSLILWFFVLIIILVGGWFLLLPISPYLHIGNMDFKLFYGVVSTLIFLTVVVFNWIYQTWYFQTYYYELTDNLVVIRKGVFARREISMPYERIQDVYVDQDLFDRILGLHDVHLSTATFTSGMEAHIDGVRSEAANGLKQQLVTTIGTKLGRSNFVKPSNNGTANNK